MHFGCLGNVNVPIRVREVSMRAYLLFGCLRSQNSPLFRLSYKILRYNTQVYIFPNVQIAGSVQFRREREGRHSLGRGGDV